MCWFDTQSNVIVMCSEQLWKERNGKAPIEFLKKQYKYVPYLPVCPGECWDSTLKQIMTVYFLILSIHQLPPYHVTDDTYQQKFIKHSNISKEPYFHVYIYIGKCLNTYF